MNRLLSKGMSNIETFLKLRFSRLKNLSPSQIWEATTHADVIEF